MLTVKASTRFKRDVKRMDKRGKTLQRLKVVVNLLENEENLPPKYKDHMLTGNWSGYRDCHIEPDWLLIYKIVDDCLELARTGTHSDLGF